MFHKQALCKAVRKSRLKCRGLKCTLGVIGLYMIIIEGKPQYDAVCAWMHDALICSGVCLRSPLCSWQRRSSGPSAGAPWWIWYVIGGDTGCYTPAPPACECVCLCLCAYERWRSWKFPAACLPACLCDCTVLKLSRRSNFRTLRHFAALKRPFYSSLRAQATLVSSPKCIAPDWKQSVENDASRCLHRCIFSKKSQNEIVTSEIKNWLQKKRGSKWVIKWISSPKYTQMLEEKASGLKCWSEIQIKVLPNCPGWFFPAWFTFWGLIYPLIISNSS